ncbi:FAD-dependent oxidoreductase [Desulfobacterales bacterium HSG16]|nr:FAD-dependent oxidoreductase [Desulfobacterales bacterium HSG16]
MIEAILVMLILGCLCGTVLSLASKIFYVYEDPRIAEVEGHMAAANCGGCGFAGCSAAAVAVVEGKAPPSVCVVAGAESAGNIAAVMGLDPGTAESKISYNKCNGGFRAADKFVYDGVITCRAVAATYGGKRECSVGCLGYGDCVSVCNFNAIVMGSDGYPVIDELQCVGCGACEKICPKGVISIESMTDRLLHTNLEDDALAPCQQTCPAEINIPKYIEQIRTGNYEGAVSTIRERNPLLLSCGRVCPHPCEDYCRRGIEDEAVSINQLKRFAADFEMNSGKRFPIPCAPDTGKSVAVIGAGPAGLSCAFFLRRLGHDVTIYEAMPHLGGMIRYGIPEYRLPKKILDWEIQGILDLGIKAVTNARLGEDFDYGTLALQGFDAIFMGVGAWVDYTLNVDGEKLNGCYTGIDFLSRLTSGEKIPVPKRAAIIGGGNSAIDCVRNLKRLGVEEVDIVYRRTRAEMPANEVEIEAAEHEGINFTFLAAPVRVVGDEDGNATHLEYLKMELGEPDASGRRRPVPIEGSETMMEVDMIITAIGQRPDISFVEGVKRLENLKMTRWNTFDTDPETLQANIPNIFTAGDSATGPALVVDAIGGGRRAARSIHQYLTGEEVKAPEKSLFKKHIQESIFESVPGVKKIPRAEMTELSVEERITSFIEVDQVLTEEEAMSESSRCLTCCRLCYNKDGAA